MPDGRSQPYIPSKRSRIAVGAGDRFPIVLVEVNGALGVLAAERRCPDETLDRVLYFRSLMGQPYARFFERVELETIGDFTVARAPDDGGIFFEPSSIPYVMENLSQSQYDRFVDFVVEHDCERAERLIRKVFATVEGFALDSEGLLVGPTGYATAMDRFIGSHPFVEPHEPRKNKG